MTRSKSRTPETAPETGSRPRGRPREFDEHEVLQTAMEVFWEKGYQNASLDDVLQRTGLARQSLYRTFGDKRTLFLTCLEHYDTLGCQHLDEVLDPARPGLEGLRDLLRMWRRGIDEDEHRGCLVMNAVAEFGHLDDPEVRERLLAIVHDLERRIRDAVQRAKAEGDLPDDVRPLQVARGLVGVVQALSVLASGGAGKPMLRDVLKSADALLPAV